MNTTEKYPAKGSVDTRSLRDVLIQRDMLSVLAFKSTPEGKKVFSELGITNFFGLHSQDGLYCKDIVQITYQNKVLSTKKERKTKKREYILSYYFRDLRISLGEDYPWS
ncbi:MAG: hypothetical protein ACLRYY_01855 [Anaerobutyricum soehngenii]